MYTTRPTAEIHDDITAAYTQNPDYAELGRLWREMSRAATNEKAPGWAQLAAALLADDYDREAGRA